MTQIITEDDAEISGASTADAPAPIETGDVLLQPAGALGVEALVKFLLGRDPRDGDLVDRLSKEIYAYVLRHILVSREFSQRHFQSLAVQDPAQFGPFIPLTGNETRVLEGLFGAGPWIDSKGVTRVPEVLTEAHLVNIVRRRCLSKQLEQLDEVFARLRDLRDQIRLYEVQGVITYRRTHSRRWVASLPFDRHPVTSRPLEAELVVMKPTTFRKTLPVVAAEGGGYEAVFEAPLLRARPHQGFGEMRLRQMGDASPASYLSQETFAFTITADNIKGTLDSIRADTEKVTALADQGYLDDALVRVTRRISQVPFCAVALCRYVEISALIGDFSDAAAFADQVGGDNCDNPALYHNLMARLALSHDDMGGARQHFEAIDTAAHLSGENGASGENPGEVPTGILLRYAAGIRSDTVMNWVKTLPEGALPEVAVSTSGFCQAILDFLAQKPERTETVDAQLAHTVITAMVRAFLPVETIAALAISGVQTGLIAPKRLVSEASNKGRLYTVLALLGWFSPDQIDDAQLSLAITRSLMAADDRAHALAFARHAAATQPSPEILRLTGDLLLAGDDIDGAIAAYESSLALAPDPDLTRQMLQLELSAVRKNPTRSQANLQELLETERERLADLAQARPEDAAIRLELGRTDMAAGRYAEAQESLEVVSATRTPLADDARFELMRLFELRSDWPAVVTWFGRLAHPQQREYAILLAVKALRLQGDLDGSQALIAAHLSIGSARLHREWVRNLFMQGQLDDAATTVERGLDLYPAFADLHLLAAAIRCETADGDKLADEIAWLEACADRADFENDLPFYSYALARMRGEGNALAKLDALFAQLGAQGITADQPPSFDSMAGTGAYAGTPPVTEGPLVSIIMTTFNSEAFVATAVRSILQQSYQTFELIIVDDASTDTTPRLLKALRDKDPRITLKLKTHNEGTYVSKNNGMTRAKGEFIAFQDSDDWSHPDRLAISIATLQAQPDLVAVQTQWARMTSDARPVIKDDGYIAHRSCISLVVRRDPVMDKVGFFDSVRVSADREYIQRIELAFGPRALGRLTSTLMFGRAHDASLTNDPLLGFTRQGSQDLRRTYEINAQTYHASLTSEGGSAYMPFPLKKRLFEAPAELLPTR